MIAGCCLNVASGEVRMPAVFSDHMVLQRDRPLPIWGWADPSEKIRVAFGSEKAETTAGADGAWQCILRAQPVSAKGQTLTIEGKNQIHIEDVLLGDIWLCSGQSNMEWGLGGCDAPEDIQKADFPGIRHFGVELHFAATPQKDVKGRWSVCTPQTSPGFTAVGFYFARRVFQETGVPIGLLRSSVGGTNIELWMSQETLMNTPALGSYGKMMRDSLAQYQTDLAASLPAVEAWTKESRDAMTSGRPIPMPPMIPDFPFGEKAFRPRCVTLHNGMIRPLVPFALRGVLWYQGENNAGGVEDGKQYVEKKRAMISDWRKWFGDPDLPFYFVQLASWQAATNDPGLADGWAFFRDAQRQCLSIPHTGMAVATDVGDALDIHPKNKFDIGERLARWALRNEYSKEIECSGPLYKAQKIEGNQLVVEFEHVGSGLMIGLKDGRAPVIEAKDQKLARFAIAGEDRKWMWADAKIEGEKVICSHPQIAKPVAVRYAFSMNPEGANLYNREGLPASPFRSDDW